LLVAAGDWRLVFLVNLPIGAAAVILGRRHLIESARRDGDAWLTRRSKACSE
jgi:hypothetical protein